MEQIVGIASLLCTLVTATPHAFEYPVWIVTTKEIRHEVARFLRRVCGNLDYRFISFRESPEDKYYIQMGLTRVFENLKSDECLIYLDYDHVALNLKGFPFLIPKHGICVSSEVKDDVERQLVQPVFDSRMLSELPQNHCNTSVIYGHSKDLLKVGRAWHRAYDDLRPFTSFRHRVELAFTLAAQRMQVSLLPCHTAIQSNFKKGDLNCCFFHYGGDSDFSSEMRCVLAKSKTNSVLQNIQIDDVLTTNIRLVEKLTILMSRFE